MAKRFGGDRSIPVSTRTAECLVVSLIALLVISSFVGAGKTHPTTKRAKVTSATPVADLPIFDLITDVRDLNGFPLNPKWGEQINHPGGFPDPADPRCPVRDFTGPECTSPDQTPTLDQPIANFPICVWGDAPGNRVNGHVNWTTATYEGSICWGGASLDGDYDWSLKPDGGAGLTIENHPRTEPKNPQYIHVEFNSSETSDAFRSSLWSRFKRFLDSACSGGTFTCDEVKGRRMVDGRRAIVTGLVGLDSEHGGYSELHPVYAMAIQTELNTSHPDEDNWMVFARNWGDEGFCSGKDSHDLPAELTTLKILVPVPKAIDPVSSAEVDVTGADIRGDFFSFDTRDCPTATFIKGKGIVLTFNTPTIAFPTKPVRRPLIEGEVHIQWHTTGTIQSIPLDSCHPALKTEFKKDQDELERFLIGRLFTDRERTRYFQEIDAASHPRTISHCSAMNGPVPESTEPAGASLTIAPTPALRQSARRLTSSARPNRDALTKYRLMKRAALRARAYRRKAR